MSMMFYDQNDLRPVRRQVWGRLFGHCVGKTREAAGCSVEEAARLAGMATSEWAAIEAGYVPKTGERLELRGLAVPGWLGAINLPAAAPDHPGH